MPFARYRALTSTILSTLAISSFSSFAIAETEKPKVETALEAITVYATRSPQSNFVVPSLVSQIQAEAPGNALSGDVGDLLAFTPGVEIDNGPRRSGQTVSIRGFDDEAVITMIDGRRQNFESAHDGRFFIDPALLKSVEVVKGASSASYGGGAIGGVVHCETKEANDLLAPGETFGGQTSFGYRSANQEYNPLALAYARDEAWDVLGGVVYRDSDDIRQGDGNKLDTEEAIIGGLLKLGYHFNEFHTLKLSYQGRDDNTREPNNGASTISFSNPIVDKDIKDHQLSLKYAFDNPDFTWLNPKVHLYHNDTEIKEKDSSGSNNGRVQERALETTGFTLDNQTKFEPHILSYGFEIYQDEQQGKTSTASTRSGVPNAKATNYGIYLQDELTQNTTLGEFLIIPALRFDAYKSEDKANHSQDEHKLSPKFSLSYKPIDGLMFFGSWAKAFRAPNLTELYPTGRHFPGIPFVFPNNNFVPNPDLKPETVTSIEFGMGVNFQDVFVTQDRAHVKGSWFQNKGKDFITREINIAGGTTRNLNIPHAILQGFELEGGYEIGKLVTKLGLSYVEAENEDTGAYLSNNVPLTFVTDVSYRLDAISSIIGWRARFAEENDKVGAGDVKTDGYAVHDIYYRLTPEHEDFKNLTFDIGVENIFDTSYFKRVSTIREEGRSFVARVSYKW